MANSAYEHYEEEDVQMSYTAKTVDETHANDRHLKVIKILNVIVKELALIFRCSIVHQSAKN